MVMREREREKLVIIMIVITIGIRELSVAVTIIAKQRSMTEQLMIGVYRRSEDDPGDDPVPPSKGQN